MKKAIQNWLESSKYDLETAGHMFRTGRYIYTVFMCHLAIEKILKAKVEEITNIAAPRTHDLIYLMELSKLAPPDKDIESFISRLSNLSVVTRYPIDFRLMLKEFSMERAEYILNNTREIYQWIEKTIKL